jgi:hypothetical protein
MVSEKSLLAGAAFGAALFVPTTGASATVSAPSLVTLAWP